MMIGDKNLTPEMTAEKFMELTRSSVILGPKRMENLLKAGAIFRVGKLDAGWPVCGKNSQTKATNRDISSSLFQLSMRNDRLANEKTKWARYKVGRLVF